MPSDRGDWHRETAADTFNRSWDLLERPDRTDDDAELLALVFTSRWHWGRVGTTENTALGDHHIAKVASELRYADLALFHAQRALAVAEREGWEGWRLAACYEGMARACSVAGDTAERDRWFDRARAVLAMLDADDRKVIEDQLTEIPGWIV